MEAEAEEEEAAGSEASVYLQSILLPRRRVLPSPEAGGLRALPPPRCPSVPSADGPGRELTSWSCEEGTKENVTG